MMESDPEISDDELFEDDDISKNCAPFPDECDDEVHGIESFYACFQKRYNTCVAFYTGSLSAACEAAFSSKVVEERRPVLVYIHNDKNIMLNNIFCQTIFCSETIIDYLLENYIVWPWNITSEWNRNKLIEVWEDIFSVQLPNNFSTEQCPMLIGIMRRSPNERAWTSKSEYQGESLLKSETLTRTGEKPSRERVLNELAIFKEKCDDNEQILSFDFVDKTGLSWELVLEIAKYLSLNDAITAFSDNILSLIQKGKIKVQISEPSKSFINMIRRKINLEQIVSLRLNAVQLWYKSDLPSFAIFTNVISLTLLNPDDIEQINKYIEFFPKLNCLSLWYDHQIYFHKMANILQQLRRPIRRFEIHCPGVLCTCYLSKPLYTQNFNVEYFLFDVGYFPLSSTIECARQDKSCFLLSTINFIKYMHNIQYIRIITNKHNVDKILDWNKWKTLVDVCQQLKKVTIEMLQNILSSEQLVQKAMEIKKVLHTTR